MFCKKLFFLLLSTVVICNICGQFPNGQPHQWGQLPQGQNNRLGAFGGGNDKSGSVNIGGQQRLNDKWDARGSVGVDYGPNGYRNNKVDVGLGYNVDKNTQIRGSVGIDKNNFGSDKRISVGIEHRFGNK